MIDAMRELKDTEIEGVSGGNVAVAGKGVVGAAVNALVAQLEAEVCSYLILDGMPITIIA